MSGGETVLCCVEFVEVDGATDGAIGLLDSGDLRVFTRDESCNGRISADDVAKLMRAIRRNNTRRRKLAERQAGR